MLNLLVKISSINISQHKPCHHLSPLIVHLLQIMYLEQCGQVLMKWEGLQCSRLTFAKTQCSLKYQVLNKTRCMINCVTLKNGCSMCISFAAFTHRSPVHQSSLVPSTTATGPATLHPLSSPDTYPSHQTTGLAVKSESPTLMNTDQPLSENVS